MVHRIIARLVPLFPKKFIWLFSCKYIAGSTLTDALKTVRRLGKQKIECTIDFLGESIASREQAIEYQQHYLLTIEETAKANLNASFSLKPTMFGLLWNEDFCYRSIRDIVIAAMHCGLFVRIDMEDSQCTDKEIGLFERLYKEFPDHVGIVFQSCLKRTLLDIKYIKSIAIPGHRPNIRLCKNIYRESPDIAYQSKQDIRNHFLQCLGYMFEHNIYLAIATHDNYLVDKAVDLLKLYNKSFVDYEFQMLLGVTPKLRTRLVSEGHTMCVYVPYGEQWFQYSSRRLQENPHMVWDIIKSLFIRN